MAQTKNLLLFRKWDLSDIEVKDPGLKTAISLRKQILPLHLWSFSTKEIQQSRCQHC